MSVAQKNNPWFGISMVLIGLVIGYSAHSFVGGTISGPSAPSAPVPSAPTPSAPTTADNMPAVDLEKDHIRGNKNAKIAIVEYSDFECPFCKRHHPTLEQVMEKYGDEVMWVYRHYPLSFHANAMPGAVASECVTELAGKDAFWDFADKVFAADAVSPELYESVAVSLGVKKSDYETCIKSGKYDALIAADQSGGTQAGVTGTPGNVVINLDTKKNQLISGAYPLAQFDSAIAAVK